MAGGSSKVCRASEIAAPPWTRAGGTRPAKGGRPTPRPARPAWRERPCGPAMARRRLHPHCRAHRPGMIERPGHRECPRHTMRRARSPIALRLAAHEHAAGGAGERRRLAAGCGVAVGERHQPTVDDVGESPSASTLGVFVVDWRRASPSRRAPATGARTPGSQIASRHAAASRGPWVRRALATGAARCERSIYRQRMPPCQSQEKSDARSARWLRSECSRAALRRMHPVR